jgi:hypothetical protein
VPTKAIAPEEGVVSEGTFQVIDSPRVDNPSRSSEESRLIVDDVSRFWAALDQPMNERVRAFEEIYLQQGTPGLTDFLRLRIGSAEELAATVKRHESFYRSIRSTTLRAEEFEDQIRATFFNLSRLLPEAIFPDVYFLIGKLTTAGTIERSGILIGLEMFCFTAETELQGLSAWHRAVLKAPEALPHIVAHELIHVQQFALGDHPAATASLLGLSVSLGIADFLGEMISGAHINQHVHDGARPREKILWRQFQQVMNQPTTDGWLYSSSSDSRPADLGYFIGYRIAQAYYRRADKKVQVVCELLSIHDYDDFLDRSGYAHAPNSLLGAATLFDKS